jgi:ubiquinone/menaquinone biosynthesis C-methylase UbiE
MADQKRDVDQSWEEKSAEWKKTAYETVSKDDAPNQLLIDLAGIRAGDSVLDLASGTGEPSISIALHVGGKGRVTATDVTPNMLNTARQRAERLGLGNMNFEVCGMEALPFEDRSFDAVTCRFGVMHASDPLAALKEARRALKPGKKAVFMVHGPRASNTLWTTVHVVGPRLLHIDDSKRVEHHFKFSEGDELAELFRTAGFDAIEEKQLRRTVVKSDDEPFWNQLLARDYGKFIEALDETQQAELHDGMAVAFREYQEAGAYKLLTAQRFMLGTAM